VFQEYVYAHAVDQPAFSTLSEVLCDAAFQVSPLFAWLCFAREDAATLLSGVEAAAWLYESLLVEPGEVGAVKLTVVGDDASAPVKLSFGIDRPEASADLSLLVDTSKAPLLFLRKLRYADVDVGCDVRLGVSNWRFVLGPSVFVKCSSLSVPAAEIVVVRDDAASGGRMTQLYAADYEQTGETRIRGDAEGTLRVCWQRPSYPWNAYAVAPPPPPPSPELGEAFRHLARMASRFGRHGFASLSCARHLVDNIVVGGTPMASELRDFLLAERILGPAEKMYVLSTKRLAELGMNWSDVQLRIMDKGVEKFLTRFLKRG
jgi:hypothetical protein